MSRKEKIRGFLSAFILAAVLATVVFLQIKPISIPAEENADISTPANKLEKGWIGIGIKDMRDRKVLVVDVVTNSPASDSGIRKGDIVHSINGVNLKNRNHLRDMIAIQGIGKSITLGIVRNGSLVEVPVIVSQKPENANIVDVKR